MSVTNYLENISSNLLLSNIEKSNIATSINAINNRLNLHFGANVKEKFQFGSYTRETILPRKSDERSDVDYIVIFNNPNNYKPQTLLRWLKDFVEKYYHKSEIYQSHPTIVLEMAHIKFELVPATKDMWGTIYIPSHSSDYIEWMATSPNSFNTELINANIYNSYKIKPVIRLLKYWNVKKLNRHYSTYLLEKWVVEKSYYGCSNLKDYFLKCIEDISYEYNAPQYFRDAIDNAKIVANTVKEFERNGYTISAENEIKKIIPELQI